MKMKKIVITTIGILMLAASFYAGTLCGRARAVTKESSFNAIATVATLATLRDGDTPKAISLLEHMLDGNTLAIGRWINSPLTRSSHPQMTEALKRIVLYRLKNPRTPEAMLDVDSMSNPAARDNILKQNEFNAAMNADIERILNDPAYSLEKSEK